jgi:Dyp-type peroxidase family
MISDLDLPDIQGNIVKAYGRYGFPRARYIFYRVDDSTKGRQFVAKIAPLVTTSVPWGKNSKVAIPAVAVNIAFTYEGLKHLDVPESTLHGFQDEFSMGMKARRDIVGDTGPNHYKHWDKIWNDPEDEFRQHVHILIGINGKDEEHLEDSYVQICGILEETGGVTQLTGHRGPNGEEDLPYQPAMALEGGKEHFGYSDGVSSPYFKGCGENPRFVIGGGKPTGEDPSTAAGWEPLEAGEFVFGHADEAGAYPEAPGPPLFSRNGTFMVYRKLHENVGSFNKFIEAEGKKFPGGKEAFAAKLSGRWRNGAPLANFPTEESANRFVAEMNALQQKTRGGTASREEKERLAVLQLQLTGFDYNDDTKGAKCPFGAHIRRVNPRSALQFGEKDPFETPGALSNRRRLLRRGLPYGQVKDPTRDDGDHGIVIMIVNADLSRQFEFVQQQWINYGNDFRLANDTDPLLGNHGERGNGRMLIEGDADARRPPYFCANIPTFVETRGGDYFFIPSMTCLRMIALGIVDTT